MFKIGDKVRFMKPRFEWYALLAKHIGEERVVESVKPESGCIIIDAPIGPLRTMYADQFELVESKGVLSDSDPGELPPVVYVWRRARDGALFVRYSAEDIAESKGFGDELVGYYALASCGHVQRRAVYVVE